MSGVGAAPSRDAIVATAHESIARGSKSFAAASLLFDRPTRERAWLLYAWCRACDDIADGQDHGHGMTVVDDAPARIAAMATLTDAALAGHTIGIPAFDALRIVAAETGLPARFAHDLIAGFRLDGDGWRPRTEDDLYLYCYHVAGVVGCMMAVIMGVAPDDEAVLDRACDLGMAFQLANIARDLSEDAAAGRCYIPQDWLAEFGVPHDDYMASAHRPALVAMARRMTDTGAAFEASARVGTRALSMRSAWAVLAAAHIYGAIGRTVAARGSAAWDRRVTTSKAEKLAFILRARGEAARRMDIAETPRPAGLWRRPR
ncbi:MULTISPECIES: phytoene/squalene synthase family protein [unclassified Sphingomonas]|uniref:phytoene/squalene synthase family protein n=1 Tax=unclassified Sphingomonas TaxID=196159 RepID=UPI000E10653E|nr:MULTISPECIES: phytoene/squalene synthase family protein [unclassified Sphingomonas]AXJ95151.1 phytoene/squalene synthase family protein [Sphingomonas sp. FARSPH]